MLRLKQMDTSINPAHIERVSVFGNDVIILMASETGSITIQLETIEDAIVFAAYVELLVDISNTGRTVKLNEIVEKSESYFENKDILSPRVQWKEKRLN